MWRVESRWRRCYGRGCAECERRWSARAACRSSWPPRCRRSPRPRDSPRASTVRRRVGSPTRGWTVPGSWPPPTTTAKKVAYRRPARRRWSLTRAAETDRRENATASGSAGVTSFDDQSTSSLTLFICITHVISVIIASRDSESCIVFNVSVCLCAYVSASTNQKIVRETCATTSHRYLLTYLLNCREPPHRQFLGTNNQPLSLIKPKWTKTYEAYVWNS